MKKLILSASLVWTTVAVAQPNGGGGQGPYPQQIYSSVVNPGSSVSTVLASAHYGDSILLKAGVHTVDNVTIPKGVNVFGLGNSTIVTSTIANGHKSFILSDNSSVNSLRMVATLGYGVVNGNLFYPLYFNGTNCLVNGVVASSDSDVLSGPSTRISGKVIDCKFDSFYDTIAFKQSDDGTNSVLTLLNSEFHTHGDVTNLYGELVGDGVNPTSSGNNYINIGHALICSGFYDGTNAGIFANGCIFDTQDAVSSVNGGSGKNYAFDLGGDDDSGGNPAYALVSGCTFISKFRTNLLDAIISAGGGPTAYPAIADVYLSSGSILNLQGSIPSVVTNRSSTFFGNRKETISLTVSTNGALAAANYFAPLCSGNTETLQAANTNRAMALLPSGGFYSNMIMAVSDRFPTTTNLVVEVQTNTIAAGAAFVGTVATPLKLTLPGGAATLMTTNTGALWFPAAVGNSDGYVGTLRITPSAVINQQTISLRLDHYY